MAALSFEHLPSVLADDGVTLELFDTASDIDALCEALPVQVWEHIPGGQPASAQELRERMLARISATPPQCRTWLVRVGGVLVGTTSHFLLASDPSAIEIGATYMSPTTWGTGLNGLVKRLMIDLARQAGAQRVRFQTDERNDRSAAAIQKLGARADGTRLETIVRADGTIRTSRLFVLDL